MWLWNKFFGIVMIRKYIAGAWVILGLCICMYAVWPDKKNRLEFIDEKIKEVEEKRKILTQKEIELEKLATEKDWEEVDKDSNK